MFIRDTFSGVSIILFTIEIETSKVRNTAGISSKQKYGNAIFDQIMFCTEMCANGEAMSSCVG